jgi:hypothetical protein
MLLSKLLKFGVKKNLFNLIPTPSMLKLLLSIDILATFIRILNVFAAVSFEINNQIYLHQMFLFLDI